MSTSTIFKRRVLLVVLCAVMTGCAGVNDAVNAFSTSAGFHPRTAGEGQQMHSTADVERFAAAQEKERLEYIAVTNKRGMAALERNLNSGGWVNGRRAFVCADARNEAQRTVCAFADAGIDVEVWH